MGLFDWLGYGVSHGYYPNAIARIGDTPHYATDIGTPYGTPITALFSGTVVSQRTGLPWGTEVFIKPDNSSIPEYYYYHLDTLTTNIGQHVQAGDLVGLSGGQNSGGNNPSTPGMSSGPHTHVGFFSDYRTVINNFGKTETIPYGPDMLPYIQALAKGASIAGLPLNGSPSSNSTFSIGGVPIASFAVETGQKIGLIIASLTLVAVGALFIFPKQVEQAKEHMKQAVKKSAEIAVVA